MYNIYITKRGQLGALKYICSQLGLIYKFDKRGIFPYTGEIYYRYKIDGFSLDYKKVNSFVNSWKNYSKFR